MLAILQAFLALALSMLSLSTIATVAVELVNRVLHFRGNDLRRMLQSFYETELQELVNSQLGLTDPDKIAEQRDAVVKTLISNPLVPAPGRWRSSWMKDLTKLSTADMIKLLPKTAVGRALAARSAEEVDALLDNAIVRYEQYGDAASDFFRRRSQVASIIAGIVIAFMLNVDALLMLQTYAADPAARQAVLAHTESIIATWEQVNDGEEPSPRRDAPAGGDVAQTKDGQQGAPGGGGDDAGGDGNGASQLQPGEEELKQMRALVDDLRTYVGVPLGYHESLPPRSFLRPSQRTSSTTAGQPPGASLLQFGYWFIRVLASGLLIGLGGPFWFNAVKTLMSLVGERALGTPGNPSQPAATPAPGGATAAANANAELKASFNKLQQAEQILGSPSPPQPPSAGE